MMNVLSKWSIISIFVKSNHEMEVRHTGQDFKIHVTIQPEEGGSITVADLQGLLIYVIHKTGKILKKYSQNSLTGFGDITLTQEGNNVLAEINVESDDSVSGEIGEYNVEVKLQTEDQSFSDNNLHTIQLAESVFFLSPAHSRNQALTS